MLWITFKSCIFAFWNNMAQLTSTRNPSCELHSNLVSLHSETTRRAFTSKASCCELHSNLVSLHSETTGCLSFALQGVLWITFKSCIFAFWNNNMFLRLSVVRVVNYIQILYLCILKQPGSGKGPYPYCCELHSNLVSLHSEILLSGKNFLSDKN